MIRFFTLLVLGCIPLLGWTQTTQTKNDAGEMGGTSGFFETYQPVNYPTGATGWWHLLDVRHSNVNNNFAMQLAGSFFDQNLWFRKTYNAANTEWARVVTETNGNINLNSKIYVATSNGQNFFTGHQTGTSYGYTGGIFKAITDNPYGGSNVYYEGATAGVTNFLVRANGEGYFAGGLGIGTQNLSAKLTVAGGDIKAANFDNHSGITIGAEASQQPRIGFHVSDNSRRFKIELNDINSPYERLGFFSSNSGQSAEQEIFTINKAGNVGIGENVPRSILHVKSGSGAGIDGGNTSEYNSNSLIIEAKTGGRSTTSGAQIEFMIPATTDGKNPWGQGRIITVAGNLNDGNAAGKMILGTRRYFDKFKTGPQWFYGNDIVIDELGNIGMGTLMPKEKLSVYGTVRAVEVKVESTNWPDYVFEAGYKVETLDALESYIKTNRHLPEMPTAKEVETNGVALGEMNKQLLKKIEELTLHLIAKDKQISDQEKRLKAVEQLLNIK